MENTDSCGGGGGATDLKRARSPADPDQEMLTDWRLLPNLVLLKISDKLEYPSDYLSFLRVCVSWRDPVMQDWPLKKRARYNVPPLLPMIFFPRRPCGGVYSFVSGNRVRRSGFGGILRGPSCVVIGSSFGWLIVHEPVLGKKHPNLHLLNMKLREKFLIGKRLNTPAAESMSVYVDDDDLLFGKAVLSAEPSENSQFAVVFMCERKSTSTSMLYITYFHGNPHPQRAQLWSTFFKFKKRQILDISSVDGKIFWADRDHCQIGYLNNFTRDSTPKRRKFNVSVVSPFRTMPVSEEALHRYSRRYLVQRSGGRGNLDYYPFLVFRHRENDEETGNITTSGFKVFSLEHSMLPGDGGDVLAWTRVTNLDGDAMFLSRYSAFCVDPGDLAFHARFKPEPNCIYYLDEEDSGGRPESDLDMGVFDVGHGCKRPAFPQSSALASMLKDSRLPPIWFTFST